MIKHAHRFQCLCCLPCRRAIVLGYEGKVFFYYPFFFHSGPFPSSLSLSGTTARLVFFIPRFDRNLQDETMLSDRFLMKVRVLGAFYRSSELDDLLRQQVYFNLNSQMRIKRDSFASSDTHICQLAFKRVLTTLL